MACCMYSVCITDVDDDDCRWANRVGADVGAHADARTRATLVFSSRGSRYSSLMSLILRCAATVDNLLHFARRLPAAGERAAAASFGTIFCVNTPHPPTVSICTADVVYRVSCIVYSICLATSLASSAVDTQMVMPFKVRPFSTANHTTSRHDIGCVPKQSFPPVVLVGLRNTMAKFFFELLCYFGNIIFMRGAVLICEANPYRGPEMIERNPNINSINPP